MDITAATILDLEAELDNRGRDIVNRLNDLRGTNRLVLDYNGRVHIRDYDTGTWNYATSLNAPETRTVFHLAKNTSEPGKILGGKVYLG